MRKEDNFIETFSLFKNHPDTTAFYTTRKLGFSNGCFSSLNLGLHVGDKTEDVNQNRRKLRNFLNTSKENIFFMDQIHSRNIFILNDKTKTELQKGRITDIPKTDALITNIRNTAICSMGADCPQIALYDHHQKVIAVIHAGWKGIVNNIIEKTLAHMFELFNCKQENIHTSSSAFLCEKCFEVKEDTAIFFKEKFPLNKKIITYSNKTTINLKEAIKTILLENDIPQNNINFLNMCTACNNDVFFSYRKENKKCGRNALVVKIN